MTKRQKCRYRRLLDRKKGELLATLKMRDGITIAERTPDEMDEICSSNDRDLAIQALDREASLLSRVQAALESLEIGDYGTCAACEESIPQRRLAAIPWARLCLGCQEREDREGHEEELLNGHSYWPRAA